MRPEGRNAGRGPRAPGRLGRKWARHGGPRGVRFFRRALGKEGGLRVKPAVARSSRSATSLSAVTITVVLALGASPSPAAAGLRPDPAPSARGGGIQPESAPSARGAPAASQVPAAPRVAPRRSAPQLPAVSPHSSGIARRPGARTHRRKASAHHPTRHRRLAGPPSLSVSAGPFLSPPANPRTGDGLDDHWLLLATSTLLLVVLLGGSLFVLAAGQMRSSRP
jgi:hypothetical protein